MLQVNRFRTSQGMRGLAQALIVGSLIVLAGVSGYEIGSVTQHPAAATNQVAVPAQSQPEQPAPDFGLQP